MAAELLSLNRTTFIERLRKKGMLQNVRKSPQTTHAAEFHTDLIDAKTEPNFRSWNGSAAFMAESHGHAEV
jgi:hypothetical protein